MCLVTEQKKAKILKKDLTVYKIVTEYGGEIYGWLRDDYKYEIGKLHEEKLVANKKTGSITDYIASEAYNKNSEDIHWRYRNDLTHIHEGFHSALILKRLSGLSFNDTIYECVIPKGSKVFKDKTGLIVSNQIILKEKICA